MKNIKSYVLIGLLSFLAFSCTSDDNNPIDPPKNEQKEVGKTFEITGTFDFNHAGAAIPFIFTENSFTIGTSSLGKENSTSQLTTLYINKENVYKAVLKQEDGKFMALFLRNVKENTMDLNMDYNFNTEKEAIDSKYPPSDASMGNHDGGQFGWLSLIRQETIRPQLPVNGTYVFDATSMGGGIYAYSFTDEQVRFDAGSPYDMKILDYKNDTHKILLEGLGSKAGTYYVIQLKDITATEVQIARDTKSTLAEAEAIFNSSDSVSGSFSPYVKQIENPIELPVNGRYAFDATAMGGGIYSYTFTNEQVSFDAGNPYDMKVLDYKNESHKILLEGLGSKAGTFYVIQLKNITASSVEIARDTKTNLEEAKTIFEHTDDVAGSFSTYTK